MGNRLTGPASDIMTYNAGNELLNLNTANYTYDANGDAFDVKIVDYH